MNFRNPSSRWLIGVAMAVGALVAASIVLATVRGDATLLPEGTPEGAVQRYLRAIDDERVEEAYAYLAEGLRESCSLSHFRESTLWLAGSGLRVLLEGTRSLGEATEVEIRLTEVRVEPPFPPSEYSYVQRLVLRQEQGMWRFVEPPWPMSWCPSLEPRQAPLEPLPIPTPGTTPAPTKPPAPAGEGN